VSLSNEPPRFVAARHDGDDGRVAVFANGGADERERDSFRRRLNRD
jgi:hypothetical protein